ncbi:peptidyl-prolyl cis-trans isomerase [bacterium]|nr:peptidyl-prolyl cis-trans isomerase [bacterium]
MLAAALSVSLAGAARGQGQSEARPPEAYRDQIVAEVEHEPITLHELEVRAQLTNEYRELKKANPENSQVLRNYLEHTLDLLVNERLVLLECKKDKIALTKEDEKRIDRIVEHQAQIQGNLDELKKSLATIGVSFEAWVELQRSNLLQGKLLLRKISRDIYVEPERLRRFYDEYKRERFRRDAVTKVLEVEISLDLKTSRVPDEVKALEGKWCADEARRYAETVRERLVKSPSEWKRIASECTMNASEVESGGLIQVSGSPPKLLADQFVWGEAADKLKVGEVSPVIATKHGYCLICMKERTGEDFLPFSEVQHEIGELLKTKLWTERADAYARRLREDAFIRFYVPSASQPAPAPAPAPESPPSCPDPQPQAPSPSPPGALPSRPGSVPDMTPNDRK